MARFKKPSKYTSLRCHIYRIDPGLANISFSKVRNLREGIDIQHQKIWTTSSKIKVLGDAKRQSRAQSLRFKVQS